MVDVYSTRNNCNSDTYVINLYLVMALQGAIIIWYTITLRRRHVQKQFSSCTFDLDLTILKAKMFGDFDIIVFSGLFPLAHVLFLLNSALLFPVIITFVKYRKEHFSASVNNNYLSSFKLE